MQTENLPTKKRSRAPNWGRDDEMRLVDAVSPHYQELFGAFSTSLTLIRKKQLWEEVEKQVRKQGAPFY